MTPATLNWDARVTSDVPDEQVSDTLALMTSYARQDSGSPPVIKEAAQLAPPGAAPEEVAEAAFWYVKRLIRFQHDETIAAPLRSHFAQAGVDYPVAEVLIRPRDIVTWREDVGSGPVGDCDDYAMLAASLLRARGIRASFVTVAADPTVPGQFSHVYVAAYTPSGRIALDTSHGAYPGWEVEEYSRIEEWPVDAGLRGILLAGLLGLILWLGGRNRKGRRTS